MLLWSDAEVSTPTVKEPSSFFAEWDLHEDEDEESASPSPSPRGEKLRTWRSIYCCVAARPGWQPPYACAQLWP